MFLSTLHTCVFKIRGGRGDLGVIIYYFSGHLRRMHQHMTFEEKDLKPSSAPQPNITRGIIECTVPYNMTESLAVGSKCSDM